MRQSDFERMRSEAIARVHEMDKIDGYKDREPLTILTALECGLRNPHTLAHWDALAMLQEVVDASVERRRR